MTHTMLIFGATGMLGWYATRYFEKYYKVIPVTRKDYNIFASTVQELETLIQQYQPTIILNCTNCFQGSYEEQFKINGLFPVLLDKIARKHNLQYIHFSTNGVFSTSTDSYSEEDLPNAEDIYGTTKIVGEHLTKATIIRTSIIGESKTNTNCLLEWLKKQKGLSIKGYTEDRWNGVTCLSLMEFLHDVIQQNQLWEGVRHITSKETITKYELCNQINQIYKLGITIEPYDTISNTILLTSEYPGTKIIEPLSHQIYRQMVFTQLHQHPFGNYTNKEKCRFCNTKTEDVLHLGDRFGLAGGFLTTSELSQDKVYPLTLSLCPRCKYMQCKQVVSSDELFKKNYYYYSSMIPPLVKHFQSFAETIYQRYPNPDSKILEIGCNDGVLLHPLKKLGYRCLVGVDPSRTILKVDPSIETYNDYFNDIITEKLLKKHDLFDIFISCNSFAHIEDMKTILSNIKKILKPTGVALIEVHYSKHIFEGKHFDFIYHEHMGYYTCTSLYNICSLFGMYLTNVEHIPMHGGSLRCTIHMQPTEEMPSIQSYLEQEAYLFEPSYMELYQKDLYQWKKTFIQKIISLQIKEKVYGYGASGRANTLMNFCELKLDGMIDDAPSKIDSYTPVFHTYIESSDILYSKNPPKYVVILAWPYAEAILEKHQKYMEQGGTFIIPLPEIRFVTA